jgi:phenylpropionate dioxygenase-like ring-hydroxylating dioxygenase large terminal subunit
MSSAYASTPQTVPFSWYCDADAFEREREAVFARSWLYVGTTAQAAEPGDYFTTSVGDVPVIVTRDEAGELHALRNVCAHRGAQVVPDGCGTATFLRCHYHAWSYGLDGALRSAPRWRDEDGFRKQDFRMRPLRLERYGPFLFVNLDPDAAPLLEHLEELPALIADTGVDLDALRLTETREYRLEANWKVVVENFLECYHCPTAHPSFADAIDLNTYRIETFDRTSTQVGEPVATAGKVRYGRYSYLWPTFMINVYPGGAANISTNRIVPLDEHHTLAVYEFFFEDGATPDFIAGVTDLIHQVMVEDIGLCESVQRGMRSRTFERGHLMLKHEHAIKHFQSLVEEAVAAP